MIERYYNLTEAGRLLKLKTPAKLTLDERVFHLIQNPFQGCILYPSINISESVGMILESMPAYDQNGKELQPTAQEVLYRPGKYQIQNIHYQGLWDSKGRICLSVQNQLSNSNFAFTIGLVQMADDYLIGPYYVIEKDYYINKSDLFIVEAELDRYCLERWGYHIAIEQDPEIEACADSISITSKKNDRKSIITKNNMVKQILYEFYLDYSIDVENKFDYKDFLKAFNMLVKNNDRAGQLIVESSIRRGITVKYQDDPISVKTVQNWLSNFRNPQNG